LNDVLLVKRVLRNNPSYLQNPDFLEKGNTSLHLAAKLGHLSIVEVLCNAGHEDESISLNAEYETPLMTACEAKKTDVGKYLLERYPRCASWKNKAGMDALMLSARAGLVPLMYLLLAVPEPNTPDPNTQDRDGNTALHHASAAGELKALRVLLLYGASPLAKNCFSWKPIAYSFTSAAEAYFKQVVAEYEKQRVELHRREKEREKARLAGVRLVTQDLDPPNIVPGPMPSSGSPVLSSPIEGSVRAVGGLTMRQRDDSLSGLPGPGLDWSPVERRAMTPTEGKIMWSFGGRGRAKSED
jgi:uncharacterized protein